MFDIAPEMPADAPAIEALLDICFGKNRLLKSSYRFRKGVEQIWPLCRVARQQDEIIGTIRYWPITIGFGRCAALLLGPVAVAPRLQSLGLGGQLIRSSLAAARSAGHQAVVLVGDHDYYTRFGFAPAVETGISIAKENPARVLALSLAGQQALPQGLVRSCQNLPILARAA